MKQKYCIKSNCGQPVDLSSLYWCKKHEEERRKHISNDFEKLKDRFKMLEKSEA